MSVFKDQVANFSMHYQLSCWDRMKLYLHYPLFKLYWYFVYASGPMHKLALWLYPHFQLYGFKVQIQGKDQHSFELPISFEPADMASFKEIFWGHEYAEVLKIKGIQTVMDIGANTGMAALFFLTNLPIKKMLMVEANPFLAEQLRKNFIDPRVRIENLAVFGERESELYFKIRTNHRDSQIVSAEQADAQTIKVDSILLSELFEKHEFECVDLLKMDIEGAEFNLIERTPDVFLRFRYIYMEIHGSLDRRNDFREIFMNLGFDELHRVGETYPNCEVGLFKNRSLA